MVAFRTMVRAAVCLFGAALALSCAEIDAVETNNESDGSGGSASSSGGAPGFGGDTSAAGAAGTAGAAGSDTAGSGGAGGGSGTGGGAGEEFGTCEAASTCQAPSETGEIKADEFGSDDDILVKGIGTTWIKVRALESSQCVAGDITTWTPDAMSLRVELASPIMENYDLYVYTNLAQDVVECTTPNEESTKTDSFSDKEMVYFEWGEVGGTVSEFMCTGSVDDSRDVMIEVRAVEASCVEYWTLEVSGG